MGRGLSFEKQQNPFLSSLSRGCIKLSSLRKKKKRKWIALPLNSKLDNIRMQQPIQAILYWPSAGNYHGETYNLQAGGSETIRELHQGNKLQKPEMEGSFRLIKDWESLVLGLT